MPNFSKSDGFQMQMGSKQKETEGSFSEKDDALLKMTPIYKALVGDQDKLPEQLKKEILNTPANAIQSKGVDGSAAYEDTTTDSIAEAEAETGMGGGSGGGEEDKSGAELAIGKVVDKIKN